MSDFLNTFKPTFLKKETATFNSATLVDNRLQTIQQRKLLNAIHNVPIQCAAVLVITEDSYKDETRKEQMKNATRAVSSKAPKKFFTVDGTKEAPRLIKRVLKIVDGTIGDDDNIDIFGHSTSSMPGGIPNDILTAKINEKFNIPQTWAGSIRIFSCYGADGTGDSKYNVALAKTFSAAHTGLKGVGGSTKMMNLSPSKAGIYPISKAYTSIRDLVGVEALVKIQERITPLLSPTDIKLTELKNDIKNFATLRPSKVSEWKAFYYNLPNSGQGWEVATFNDEHGEWLSTPTSLIGPGPGQVPSIKTII